MDRADIEKNEAGVWLDITDDFHSSAKQLALGELFHDSSFGLFEAMSAIEMMDPKMDAGMCNRDLPPPKSFNDLVEVRLDVYWLYGILLPNTLSRNNRLLSHTD